MLLCVLFVLIVLVSNIFSVIVSKGELIMSMILPVASKKVLIGCPNYQELLKGVKLINLGLTKKEDTLSTKSKININFQ